MRLPDWIRIRNVRRSGPRTITVTLTADSSQFAESMARVQAAMDEHKSMRRYYRRIAEERAKGLAYVHGLLDAFRAEVTR